MVGLEAVGYEFDARHTTPTEAFNGFLFVDASEMLVDEVDEGTAERDSEGVRLNRALWDEFDEMPILSHEIRQGN